MPLTTDIDHYFNRSLAIIKKAAAIMLDGFTSQKHVETKAFAWDFVTEFDKKVEECLIKELQLEFPHSKFIAEESTANAELTDDPTWIIDPIDGTTNFMHRYPECCISVALAIKKELVIGIVYNPMRTEVFTAKKGHGAYLNGKPIRVSKIEELSQSLLSMEYSHARHPSRHSYYMKSYEATVNKAHGIRTVGSAALSLCYVAMGGVDAYHACSLASYDIAAGALIVKEAGGTVLSTKGEKFDVMEGEILAASTPALAKSLAQLLKDF